jgi:tetratricopeptide (TPR) repeat protein
MEGLAAGLAKQRLSESIEFLRRGHGREAGNRMNDALAGGLADAACGLILLRIFDVQNNRYDEIIRELQATLKRFAEQPTTLEIGAYGYYLLGRCHAILGIKKERFQSDIFGIAFRRIFRNEFMEKASSFYLQSIARDTSLVESAFELGLVYDVGFNSQEKAIEAYKMVIELKSDHTLARENLASLCDDTTQRKEDRSSNRAYLLSPETLAAVPEPKPNVVPEPRRPYSPIEGRSAAEAHRTR